MNVRLIPLAAGLALATACVPQPQAPSQPQAPVPVPQPPAPPPPPPASGDWRDIPLTPGDWVYSADAAGGSSARFGAAPGGAVFVIRCDRSRHVQLSVQGQAQGNLTLRTSFGARNLPLAASREPAAYSTATLPANDPLLDNIAFSRGRFTVEAQGRPMLVIPAWAEPARVIEDCRS